LAACGRAVQTQTFVGLHLLGSRSQGSRGGFVVTVSQCQFLCTSSGYIDILKPIYHFRLDCAHKLFPVKPAVISKFVIRKADFQTNSICEYPFPINCPSITTPSFGSRTKKALVLSSPNFNLL